MEYGSWGVQAFLRLVLLDIILNIQTAFCDSYCWYTHEVHGRRKQVYCDGGCCSDHGKTEDICCFTWSVGIIIGVCTACVAVIVVVFVIILCCYKATQKRRNRTASMIASNHTNTSNISTAAAGYVIPHPPSAFYPSSQFPNAAPAVIQPTSYDNTTYQQTPQSAIDNYYMMSSNTSSYKMNGRVS